ncbi:RHG27 protein, partial [Urocolius indicus]|nr:RHG27 protein [Urocolius indicus]
QAQKEPEESPSPIYLNIQELREEAAAGAALREPSASGGQWETHTDTATGLLFYYNPGTGESTWDCPFGSEDGVSVASSPAPSPEGPPWEQQPEGGGGQAFGWQWAVGETAWDLPRAGGDGAGYQERYPGGTRCGAMEQRPPTPETDYPDLSADELEAYSEENYSPAGSCEQGGTFWLSPRPPEELGSPPGWYGHSHPQGTTFSPEYFTPDTV